MNVSLTDGLWLTMLRLNDRNRIRGGRNTVHPAEEVAPVGGCCNGKDRVVCCGSVSIVIGLMSIVYSTYEMHKAGEFYDHRIMVGWDDTVYRDNESTPAPTPTRISIRYHDKYGSEVTEEQYMYLLGKEQMDKGLCVGLTFVSVIHIVSCAFIIRGAKIRDMRGYVPWMVVVLALVVLGIVYVMFNIITLDFTASVNFVLFLWIVASVVELHCVKHVLKVYRGRQQQNNPNPREGMAIFDARQLNNDLFTISNGELRPTDSPVRIVFKPPTYEEALHELEELGPPPDPPDDDGGGRSIPDKPPPKYSP